MLVGGDEFETRPYSEYRNRAFERHKNKLVNSLWQIRQCSLKKEDKNKLLKEMMQLIDEFEIRSL